MLHLFIRLLSFLSGQPLLSPQQARLQQAELEDLRSKQQALENLAGKLRGELKRREMLTQAQTQESAEAQRLALTGKQLEVDSLKESLRQLNESVDVETQRQIRENNNLLNQLNWLSGTIAHDFRAPLRAIDAYSFFLADDLGDNPPPEAVRSLDEIRRNGKRMGILLDALIEYLRVGVCPLNIQLHDLQETLLQVIDEHHSFEEVPIDIQVYAKWRFDKPLMMKALKEIIDNAIKFSRPVSAPRIVIRQVSNYNLEIIDNGVGFSESHDAKKFQLFHRMHGNDEFEGEGIGLAMAERIVSRHYASLSLHRVGSQTVVSLQWPEPKSPQSP